MADRAQLFQEHRQGLIAPSPFTNATVTGGTNALLYLSRGLQGASYSLVSTLNSGSGNLTVIVQDSPDGGGSNWRDYVTFSVLSATGSNFQVPIGAPFKNVRVRYIITSTADWTFSVYEAGYGM